MKNTNEKIKKVNLEEEAINDDVISSTEKASKKDKIDFQDVFDRSFNRMVVRQNPITSREELRSLVSMYYDMQDFRISSGNRQFQLNKDDEEEENSVEEKKTKKNDSKKNISFEYACAGLKETEDLIARWLKEYVENDPIGQWLISVKGIGPVLAAGLLSYIDISKCQTAGAIWKYAGWEGHRPPKKKGEKLDYNPKFRVLCWKCGESFQKVSGIEKDKDTGEAKLDENGNPIYRSFYGKLYAEKLKWYMEKNEAGGFAERAKTILTEKKFEKESVAKKCYESGKLPDAHLISMAKRYAVKMFLSHLFEVWYEHENKCKPPKPFAEAHLGHVHMIQAPNKDILGL